MVEFVPVEFVLSSEYALVDEELVEEELVEERVCVLLLSCAYAVPQ